MNSHQIAVRVFPSQFKSPWTLLVCLIVGTFFLLLTLVETSPAKVSRVPATLWMSDRDVVNVSFNSVEDLEQYLDNSGLQWMPEWGSKIPPLAINTFPQDIATVSDVSRKKSLFFRSLLPIVLVENHNVSLQRAHILELMLAGYENLTVEELAWLESVASWYRVSANVNDQEFWLSLLRRVDRIPVPLVLAQAANESAWGTSRFALQGNNLFGLWTYDESNGLIPDGREEGEKHAVQVFSSVRDSVREYMRNLNSHQAYKPFRLARADYRRLGEPLQSDQLAQGLLPYSQRGEAYVEEIRSMIKGNELTRLRGVLLDTASAVPK